MSELVFPSSSELLSATLEAIKYNGGSATNQEIAASVTKTLGLTSELTERIHSGNRTELEYRLAWARTNAKKKGLIVPKGPKTWALA